MAKNQYLQIRVTEEEAQWIDALCDDYDLDRSKLIIHALSYIARERPVFTIEPKGKELAPGSLMSLENNGASLSL